MKQRNEKIGISSAGIHIAAMLFMLLDHMWATVLSDFEWLTIVGRMAFPLFAFLNAEGYRHTGNYRRYLLRMLAAAVIAEIPYNLITINGIFNPFDQNVLWTFIIALLCMRLIDKARQSGKMWLFLFTVFGTALAGYIIGMITMVDYHGAGVLTVLVFYLFDHRKWWGILCQVLLLWWINIELIGGLFYPIEVFGIQIEIVKQSFAMLALIPIWLYNGRQGLSTKAFRVFCYGFYPAHMLLLVLLARLLDTFR